LTLKKIYPAHGFRLRIQTQNPHVDVVAVLILVNK
jgi:hypothetical protein